LERATLLPAAESSKIEIVESAKDILPTLEVIPNAGAEVPTIQLENSKSESLKTDQQPKVMSSLVVQWFSRVTTTSALAPTPRKGRRMASVLATVLRLSKMASPAPTKMAKDETGDLEEVIDVGAAPGPSKFKSSEQVKESLSKIITLPTPEAALIGDLEFIIRHASGKQLTQHQIAEAHHYAKDLKYPQGSLVYGGDEEHDFLYCLPDSKKIDVCREMIDNMGYLNLELGLSLMSNDHLADCLAYTSLKVVLTVLIKVFTCVNT
jgi:hypothetical protein